MMSNRWFAAQRWYVHKTCFRENHKDTKILQQLHILWPKVLQNLTQKHATAIYNTNREGGHTSGKNSWANFAFSLVGTCSMLPDKTCQQRKQYIG